MPGVGVHVYQGLQAELNVGLHSSSIKRIWRQRSGMIHDYFLVQIYLCLPSYGEINF